VQARDEAKIRDHEARAFGKREFTLSPDPYGSGGLIRGRYDAAGYAVLTAALEALSTPWTQGITVPGAGPDGLGPVTGGAGADCGEDLGGRPGGSPAAGCGAHKDNRSPGQRRYDALIELGRRALHHPATSSGDGGKAQIRVTIPLTSLVDRHQPRPGALTAGGGVKRQPGPAVDAAGRQLAHLARAVTPLWRRQLGKPAWARRHP